jgi:hypothetical protein
VTPALRASADNLLCHPLALAIATAAENCWQPAAALFASRVQRAATVNASQKAERSGGAPQNLNSLVQMRRSGVLRESSVGGRRDLSQIFGALAASAMAMIEPQIGTRKAVTLAHFIGIGLYNTFRPLYLSTVISPDQIGSILFLVRPPPFDFSPVQPPAADVRWGPRRV